MMRTNRRLSGDIHSPSASGAAGAADVTLRLIGHPFDYGQGRRWSLTGLRGPVELKNRELTFLAPCIIFPFMSSGMFLCADGDLLVA